MTTAVTAGSGSGAPSARAPEPIAVIALGCRFPGGATSPERFWELLCEGRDAVVDVPHDRWDVRRYHDSDPDLPGKSPARQGGFLREPIDAFDPACFGLTPREAETLDPQQRLLLETAWETFERAGQPVEELRGSATGVFIGGFCMDNQLHRLGSPSLHLIDAFTATSSGLTLLANRLSYVFDLRGPSLSIDTACSSSLVAVHLACRSLWQGECAQALAGGVNVMLRPEFTVAMSKGGFLSRHSRSRAFDDRADGYARGEGAGLVLLKPLAAARAAGDPVLALIRMTGVNQDGRSHGITQPNPEAQQALIRQVCREGGVRPGDLAYVEAHGTGTQAGDGVELRSLDAVLRENRPAGTPCWVGAVKTNLGHLEAAAGVAALIKTVLVLQHRQVPPNLHLQVPNRRIDFNALCLRFPDRNHRLDTNGRLPLAAINSFGYGGTNAHVLLEAAPPASPAPPRASAGLAAAPLLLPLSAHSPGALRQLARLHADALAGLRSPEALIDWLHTAALRRSHLPLRLVALGGKSDALAQALGRFAAGLPDPDLVAGEARADAVQPVFVFTGMGPQWWAMGRALRAEEPVFRAAWDQARSAFEACAGWDLEQAMGADESSSRIGEAGVAQPANFVLQVALAALWRDRGVTPAAVVGHSAGEVAAAYVAGALTLEAAAAVCHHRSRLQHRLSGTGTMLSIGLSEHAVQPHLAAEPSVQLAAVNAPASVTVAGPRAALETLAARLPDTVFHKHLRVDVPYHSAEMDRIEAELREALAGLAAASPTLPCFSTVTGARWTGGPLDAAYWWRNVRDPVRFAAAAAALVREGHRVFLEIGPHPVLAECLQQVLDAAGEAGAVVPSLVRREPEGPQVRRSAARLHTLGVRVAWERLVPPGGGWCALPTYPWQHDRLWSEAAAARIERIGTRNHAFLYQPLPTPEPAWQVDLNEAFFPYLPDHRISGAVVFAGAAYVEAGLVLHRQRFGTVACVIEDLQFERLLLCDRKQPATLVVTHDPRSRAFAVHSRPPVEAVEWTTHARGRVRHLPEPAPAVPLPLVELRRRCPTSIAPAGLYASLEQQGLQYGPWFRTIRGLWVGDGEAVAQLRAHPQVAGSQLDVAHPTLVDGALQSLVALFTGPSSPGPHVPVGIGRVHCRGALPRECWAHVRLQPAERGRRWAEIVVADAAGERLLELEGVEFAPLPAAAIAEADSLLHGLDWQAGPAPSAATPVGPVFVAGDDDTRTERLLALIAAAGGRAESDPAKLPDGGTAVYLGDSGARVASADSILAASAELLAFLQRLPSGRRLRVVVVTHLAQVVTGTEPATSFAQLPWEGLVRVAGNEVAGWTCRLVDLDLHQEEQALGQLLDELRAPAADREVAYREGRRYRRELRMLPRGPHPTPLRPLREGVYLVTGGTGGFGGELARWLAGQGASHLVLVSRRGPAAPGWPDLRADLERRGACATAEAVDVSDEAAVRDLVTRLRQGPVPLRGVFHAAMVLDDALLPQQTRDRFARVYGPKLDGALHLHRQTLECDLDHFVCVSSVSSLLGNPAQANYAAANAFLDGLAQVRRRHGLPGLSVNLGLLADTGVAHERPDVQRLLASVGVTGLRAAEVLQALGPALVAGRPQVGIFRMDWARWAQAFPAATDDSRFAAVLGRSPANGDAAGGAGVVARLRMLPAADRPGALEAELRTRLAAVLRLPVEAIQPHDEFRRIGIDSLAMVELITTVNREFGLQLSAVDILRHPTLEQLSAALLARLPLV